MPRPPIQPRQRGFTLIEILFALALIAILVSILLLGATRLVSSSKESSTKVMLAGLKGMLAEFESKTRLNKSPNYWLWQDPVTSMTGVRSGANTNNFWMNPSNVAITPATEIQSLDAPGMVSEGNYDQADMATGTSIEEFTRNGSRQVLNTQLAMGLMLQMPANREALAKISPESYFIPRWVGGVNRLPAPAGDTSGGYLYFDPDATDAVVYPQGAKITTKDGAFLCVNNTGSLLANAPPVTGDGTNWAADRSPATPILLDAWRNPIILVPATGLRVRVLNGKDQIYKQLPGAEGQFDIHISPEGSVDRTDINKPKVLKPGRPFFASAGEDGDFARGDDNIYSFQQ